MGASRKPEEKEARHNQVQIAQGLWQSCLVPRGRMARNRQSPKLASPRVRYLCLRTLALSSRPSLSVKAGDRAAEVKATAVE